ncbi:MAG: hypothetical protein IH611_11935 [Deltaproteobacteria bacterium]|nr:hypothetical protein [Deltaproteobacteria bacterium]
MPDRSKDPVENAERLGKRALEIVAETRVRDLWEKVGRTFLVGSARFGLMAAPNIDFEIYVEKPDARDGFAVMREIAALPNVTGIEYRNFLGTSDPGLYWRVDYRDGDGSLWDFDNWLVPFSHPYAGMADTFASAMERALTPETRRAILDLKTALTGPAPGDKPRGIDVYRAVLEGDVRDSGEFELWLERNPPAPLETWRPGA